MKEVVTVNASELNIVFESGGRLWRRRRRKRPRTVPTTRRKGKTRVRTTHRSLWNVLASGLRTVNIENFCTNVRKPPRELPVSASPFLPLNPSVEMEIGPSTSSAQSFQKSRNLAADRVTGRSFPFPGRAAHRCQLRAGFAGVVTTWKAPKKGLVAILATKTLITEGR